MNEDAIIRPEGRRYKVNLKSLVDSDKVKELTIKKNGSLLLHCIDGKIINIGDIENEYIEFCEIRDLYKLSEI